MEVDRHDVAKSPREHTLEWGVIVKEREADAWQHWPRNARKSCGAAITRALAEAQTKWPGYVIVRDRSMCTVRPEGVELYRCVTIMEADDAQA